MKIKIISCSKPSYWYAYALGYEYTVKEDHGDVYVVLGCPSVQYWVLAKDCQIVEE